MSGGVRTGAAIAAGALLGMTYAWSPLTVWVLAIMAAVIALSARGLGPLERTWFLRIVGVAVILRLIALVGFFLVMHRWDGEFAPLLPDDTYAALRSLWLRNIALGVPIEADNFRSALTAYGRTSMFYLFALVEVWLGPAPYALRLLNAALYLTGVLVLYRTARVGFGALAALIGLALALLLPTLFVWSISLVKEAPVALATLVTIAAAVGACRSGGWDPWRRALCVAGAIVALAVLEGLRNGSDTMIGTGLAAGIGLAFLVRRPRLLVAAAAVTLLVVFAAARQPSVIARVTAATTQLSAIHIGHVNSRGYGYELLEPEFYDTNRRLLDPAAAPMDGPVLSRFVLRGLASVVLVPLPWQAESRQTLAFLPEQVVWYVLVLFAIGGTFAGLRRDPLLAGVLCMVVVTTAVVVALTNGNVGTLIRVRSMVAVPMIWLSAAGMAGALSWVAERWRLVAPAFPRTSDGAVLVGR